MNLAFYQAACAALVLALAVPAAANSGQDARPSSTAGEGADQRRYIERGRYLVKIGS